MLGSAVAHGSEVAGRGRPEAGFPPGRRSPGEACIGLLSPQGRSFARGHMAGPEKRFTREPALWLSSSCPTAVNVPGRFGIGSRRRNSEETDLW